ncbi:MAG: LamG-like jellyroll fold domain-containing protein, partial [Candidatus Thorarchaeota archaeon]
MHLNKKISLFAVSLALVFVLMNTIPQVASDSGADIIPSVIDSQDNTSPADIILPPPMLAYWELNEGGGTIVHDSVAPYITGLTYGNPTWSPGIAGTCLDLRTNQYVEFDDPAHYLFLPEVISIEAWVNPTVVSGQQMILASTFSPLDTQFYFGLRDGRLYFKQSAGFPIEAMGSIPLAIGTWNHVAVVFERTAGEVLFYLNATQESRSFSATIVAPGRVTMGGDPFGADPDFLNGLIDEVAVYDSVLTIDRIIEHYNKGLLGLGYLEEPNTPPVAVDDFYTANEGFTLFVDAQSGVLANDIDVDGDLLTAELVDWPAFGILTFYQDGSFEYFVDGWSGPVTFTYTTFDGELYSSPATVIIDVIGDDDETGPEITITYTGSSTDGNPGTWIVTVADPESGVDTINVEIDGIIAGTVAGIYAVPNILGTHTITVTATNADLDTGPSDQETSVSSSTVTIIDDDMTGPSIFITYTGDKTDINPGTWTVSVSDTISGIHSMTVEIDGTVVGTIGGVYAVPGTEGDHTVTVTALNNDLDRLSDQETSILSDT